MLHEKYHNRTLELLLFFFPGFPMHIWFWGLNVCMWGQMDTFMSAWVWIILQATSGAPHGSANCGERGRWACWRAPLRWALSNLFDGPSAQMAEQKVSSQSCENKRSSQSCTNKELILLCESHDSPVSKESVCCSILWLVYGPRAIT